MKKPNRKLYNSIIACSLLAINLFSVGFSSWNLGSGKITSDNGDFNVDVGTYIDGTLFKINSLKTFALGPDGIVNDETIVSSAAITFNFTINNYDANKGYINDGIFKFNLILNCTVPDFITNFISEPTISSCTVGENSTSGTVNMTNLVTCNINDTTIGATTVLEATYNVNDVNNKIGTFYANHPVFMFTLEGVL